MNGKPKAFMLGETEVSLRRATFSEMAAYVDRINDGEVEGILLEAAGGDKKKLQTLLNEADPGDVGKLWHEWLGYFGHEAYLEDFYKPQQAMFTRVDALMRASLEARGLLKSEPSAEGATN